MSDSNLYEGKVKTVHAIDENQAKILFHDKVTAGNGAKKDVIPGKGKINLDLTMLLFDIATKAGVPTHIIERTSETELLVKKLKIFPIEVVVRNIVAGSYARRYGLDEGEKLDQPVIEYFVKSDELNDPVIDGIIALKQKLISKEYLSLITARALQVNEVILPYFKKAGMKLVDFKLEFGLSSDGEVFLADELSGDCMRVWDADTNEVLDKDRFRKDLGDLMSGYNTILKKLQNTEFNVKPVPIKAIVNIGPKKGVTNPSGEVTKRALTNSGMKGLGNVSIGKTITVEISEPIGNTWIKQLHDVTENLLSNPLIEQYSIHYEFD